MIHKAAVAAKKFGPKSSKKFGKGFMLKIQSVQDLQITNILNYHLRVLKSVVIRSISLVFRETKRDLSAPTRYLHKYIPVILAGQFCPPPYLPPQGHWAISGDILSCQNWGATNLWQVEVTTSHNAQDSPLQQNVIWTKMAVLLRLRNSALYY